MMLEALLDPQESRLLTKKKKKEPLRRYSACSLEFSFLLDEMWAHLSIANSDNTSSEFIFTFAKDLLFLVP